MGESYESIRAWKDEEIYKYTSDTHTLNQFHDQVMRAVFNISLQRVKEEKGTPPSPFTWFVMGSAGRYEQGVISDQDHGMVYEKSGTDADQYFLALGKEVSLGLHIAGYPYCEGKVMSSNPVWCKSLGAFENQLSKWMDEVSFESMRYLQIFVDARVLEGEETFVNHLKNVIDDCQKKSPKLLKRFMDNIMHLKPSVGPLGQIFTENSGPYQGSLNLKQAAFLPYVNAVRILAIKEGVLAASTLDRIDELSNDEFYRNELSDYKTSFANLLQFRMSNLKRIQDYDDVHYLPIQKLSRAERKEMKTILKNGKKLHHFVQGIIEKGVHK
ncbi:MULTISPECIES: DUF294 nucleotidyltransferase-like domain-containing protein [Metabacillus]|uniref:DUF294 nucleotidyltransferase-like domain-containing protein n=1 Tax=Metabacillus hrfriensis TaxID=3048891 RepID=A0ACD4RAD1_9BACI|nr:MULTISPECIES: DUF294 nucleotidyltransferase-like domain-containing protein [Metabacillus]UAL51883.1 DUF294 nucleotidyltransferase-like domain-containing protein [Metabacillus dongyingensis]WHZ57399.1 DUF294 nucleotidyltransferase-like domain-containing protein [Metabacillus sp. CT-WN-B3]